MRILRLRARNLRAEVDGPRAARDRPVRSVGRAGDAAIGERNLLERERRLAVDALPADAALDAVEQKLVVEDSRQIERNCVARELDRSALLCGVEATGYAAHAGPSILGRKPEIAEPGPRGIAFGRRRLAVPLQRALLQRSARLIARQVLPPALGQRQVLRGLHQPSALPVVAL